MSSLPQYEHKIKKKTVGGIHKAARREGIIMEMANGMYLNEWTSSGVRKEEVPLIFCSLMRKQSEGTEQ